MMYVPKTNLKHIIYFLLMSLLLMPSSPLLANDECTLACRHNVHVAIGNECDVTVTPDLVLQFPDVTCPGPKTIEVYSPLGVYIQESPVVSSLYLGDTLDVKITDIESQNFCWASIIITDTQNPVFVSCEDVTIDCSITDLAPGNNGIVWPVVTDNCETNLTLTYEDNFVDLFCDDPTYGNDYIGYFLRNWTAEDAFGNSANYTQIIFLTRNQVEDVHYPINFDGFGMPELNCANADTTTTNTGVPTINGYPVTSTCEMSVYYSDQIIDLCGGGYKVYRTWEVYEWCEDDLNYHVQVIIVQDNEPPTVDCPSDTIILTATNVANCNGDIDIPILDVSGSCSSNYTFEVTLDSETEIYSSGETILSVPIGFHVLNYIILNDCGSISTCTKTIEVIETENPIILCANIDNINLDNDGQVVFNASYFDGGSTDNCGIESILIRKTEINDCNTNDSFQSIITFDCCEINTFVELELKVTDTNGNEAFCTHTVTILDDIIPSVNCPTDVTISCTDDSEDFSLVGVATATDNCSISGVSYVDISSTVDNCGSGMIQRLWIATDDTGNTDSCTQFITLNNANPFSQSNILWPQDFNTTMCGVSLSVDDLTYPYIPIISQGDCDEVEVNHIDFVLYYNYEGDQSIQRTWTVLSNCPNPGNQTSWTYVQFLTISDDMDPVLTCPSNQTYGDINDDCDAVLVTINSINVEDCDDNLQFSYEVDFGNNNSIDFTTVDNGFTEMMPLGVHHVSLTVTDAKGNSAVCSWMITCRDLINPVAMSIPAVTMDMFQKDADGVLRIYSYMFDNGSYDNCTDFDDLYRLVFPSSFTCNDIGVNEITYTVIDGAGNLDQVSTLFTITDVGNICNFEMQVEGTFSTTMNINVENVIVELDSQMVMSDEQGFYNYFYFDIPDQLVITPTKKDHVRDGVNSFDLIKIGRHVLETEPFTSPYQWVAADVNNSKSVTGADVVYLRQLLLYNIDTFNSVDSWRFISEDFVFPPFGYTIPDFPESVVVENPSNSLNIENFIGIKIGDIDNSYEGLNDEDLNNRNLEEITLKVKRVGDDLFEVYTTENENLASFHFKANSNANLLLPEAILSSGTFADHYSKKYNAIYYNLDGIDIAKNTLLCTIDFDLLKEDVSFEWFDTNGVQYNITWKQEGIKTNDDLFKVYPTIFDDKLNVVAKEDTKIQIVNSKGEYFYDNNKSINELNTTSFPPGIYFVYFFNGESTVVKKIIKH